jgi:hypothetical protein
MSWFRRRKRPLLFHYHDGHRTRSIDPQQAWLALWSDPNCNPYDDVQAAGQDGELEVAAHRRLLELICRVFKVQLYDEKTGGLTVDQMYELIGSYFQLMNDLKKKRDRLRTPSPSSASESAPESTTNCESG